MLKEKSKKVLKGVGIGALACLSVCTFAGCSELTISQNQVDTALTNLQETVQQLQEQNEYLKNLNQQALKENAWNLFRQADTNLVLNTNGVRNNLTITRIMDNESFKQIFYTNNNETVYLQIYDENAFEICYKDNDKFYEYYTGGSGSYDKKEYSEETTHIDQTFYSLGLSYINTYNLSIDDICSVEILENGNYKIKFIQTDSTYEEDLDTTSTFVETFDIVVSSDAKIISIDVAGSSFEDYALNYTSTGTETYSYIISEETITFINSCLEEAKSATVNR